MTQRLNVTEPGAMSHGVFGEGLTVEQMLSADIDRLQAEKAELLAIVREVADLGERLLSGELDPRVPPRYVGSFRLGTLIANAKVALAKAEGAS